MKKFIFLTFFILISFNCLAQNQKYTGLRKGDTVSVIDKNKTYLARFYFFVNLSHCSLCFNNINSLALKFSTDNEFVVFVYKADTEEIELLRSNFKENIKLIGDEYGIYQEYYKVNFKPLLIILDNNGVIKSWANIKNIQIKIDSILNTIKHRYNEYELNNNANIFEAKRLIIKNEGGPVITSFFRKCILRKSDNSYIFENMRSPELLIIDSSGFIKKTINVLDYPNYKIIQFFDFSWAEQDSVLFIYGNDNKDIIFQYYDLVEDVFSSVFELSTLNKVDHCIESINSTFLTGLNKFVNSIWFVGQTKNRYMNDLDTCGKLWSGHGELIKTFDKPDSIYFKYKLSDSFSNIFNFCHGNVYSIQEFSNIIKIWDSDLNLLKKLKVNLGEKYRYIKTDLPDIKDEKEEIIFWNSISLFLDLLIDEKSKNILIAYKNEIFPFGAYDFMSDKVKHEVILNIYDKNGKKLNSEDIILPKATIPFCFYDNYIYTTEMNGNKLEIVKYKFIDKTSKH